MLNVADRVKDMRKVPASSLKPSPYNWRSHPKEQTDALRAILARFGFAGAELTRELPDGTLELIDGHARAELMGDRPVAVIVTDLSEAEAKELLLMFDPVGDLAGADTEKLSDLLAAVEADNPAIQAMLDGLASRHGLAGPDAGDGDPDPGAAAQPVDQVYQILITCKDSADQAELLERLTAEGRDCKAFIA